MPKRKLKNEILSSESIGEEERWICTRCTLQNSSRRRRCDACQAHRPVAELSGSDNTSAASALNSNSSTSSSIVATWLRKRRRRDHQGLSDSQLSREELLFCDAKQCNSKQEHEEAMTSKTSSPLSSETHNFLENFGIELKLPEDIEQSLTEASRNDHEASDSLGTQNQATESPLYIKEGEKDLNSDFVLYAEQTLKEECHVAENGGVASKHMADAAEPQCTDEDGEKGLSNAVEQCLKAFNVADSAAQYGDTCEKENICDNDKGNHKHGKATTHDSTTRTTKKPTKTPEFSESRADFFYTPASQSQRDEYETGKPVARTFSHQNMQRSEETLQSYECSMQNHSSIQGNALPNPHQKELCCKSIPADGTSVLIHGVEYHQYEANLPDINANPLVPTVDESCAVLEGNEQRLNMTNILLSGNSSLHSASNMLGYHLPSEAKTNFVALATAGSVSVSKLCEQGLDTEKKNDFYGLSLSSAPFPAGKRPLLNAVSSVGVDDSAELPKQSRKRTHASSTGGACPSSSPTGQEKSVRSCTGCGSADKVSRRSLEMTKKLLVPNAKHSLAPCSTIEVIAEKRVASASFATAGSGSIVKVSEEALKKGNALFSEDSTVLPNMSFDTIVSAKSDYFPSLATSGSGSIVKISEEALKKGKALFSGDSNALMKTSSDAIVDAKSDACASFATAGSGSKVKVSEQALRKVNALFSGDSGSYSIPSSNQLASSKSSALASSAIAGSGSTIKVDEESLKKGDALVCEGSNAVPNLSFSAIDSANSNALASFATAGSGAIVQVSDEALKRVNALFSGDSSSSLNPASNQQVTSYGSAHAAFSTAGSGSAVDVSEEALKKGNASFCEDSNELPRLSSSTIVSAKCNAYVSFATDGSGTVVQASENAIRKVGAFYVEDSRSSPIPSSNKLASSKSSALAAFATAGSGSIVEVSEEALNQAKDILTGDVGQTVASPPPVEQSSTDGPRMATSSLAVDSTLSFQNTRKSIVSDKMACQSISSVPEGISHDGTESANIPLSCFTDMPYAVPSRGRSNFASERCFAGCSIRERDNQTAIWSCNVCVRLPCMGYAATPKESANPVTPFRRSVPSPLALSLSPRKDSCSRKSRMVARVSLCPSPPPPPPPQLNALCRQDSTHNLKSATKSIVNETIRMSQDESIFAADFREAQRMGHMVDSSIDRSLVDLSHVVLCVDSTNGPSVRYDKRTYLPKCIPQPPHDFSEDNLGTLDDFRAALVGRGCKMSIMTDKWLANHLRWIIWTLASFERKFAPFLARRCLSYSHVVEKLQERYDRETKDNFRSPLRAVLNRDIPSQRLIILCVSQIKLNVSREGTNCECAEIELSDGWYATRAIVDVQLTRFIQQERIRVGTKLLISGASLRGFDDGVDPLDSSYDSFDTEKSPALIISANSCRIAKWNAKLGFVSKRFSGVSEGLLRVKSTCDLLQNGGRVPLIDLVVLRRDPLMFLQKQEDCSVRVLSEQEESERIRLSENSKLEVVDDHSELFREQCLKVSFVNTTKILKFPTDESKSIDDTAPDIWKRMTSHPSPSDFYDGLNVNDRQTVDKWAQERSSLLHDQLFKEIEQKISELGKETVPSTSFLRLLVQTQEDHMLHHSNKTHAILTIWNPNEEQLDEIKENTLLRVKNTEVKPIRFNGLLQLSGGSCCVLRDSASGIHRGSPDNCSFTLRFTSFFRLFANSSKQMVDRPTAWCPLRENIVGLVLSVEYQSFGGWSILLSDESGKFLRLMGEDCVALNELKSGLTREVTDSPRFTLLEDVFAVAAFQNIIVTGYDMQRTCLIGRYTSDSAFVSAPSTRELALRKWFDSPRGRSRLLQAVCSLEVCRSKSFNVVVGYICGMYRVPSKELLLEVDLCGQSQSLVLPLSLLLSLSQLEEESIFFAEKEDKQIEQFRMLGKMLRSRKSLYSFVTRPVLSDCGVTKQVVSIHKTSTLALATMYSGQT